MISTWGIFWIALFSASVLKCIFKCLFKVYPQQKVLSKEDKEKLKDWLEKVIVNSCKEMTINATIYNSVKKSKKEA